MLKIMRAKLLKGYPVINLKDGSMAGRVQDLVVDTESKKVAALLVGEKGLLKGRMQTIDYNDVYKIGKDAITTRGKGDTDTGPAEHHLQTENKDYSFLGNTVISDGGDYIAKVQDFTFDVETGKIESLLLDDFKNKEKTNKNIFLHIEGILNLGKDYVIANANYSGHIREEEKNAAGDKESSYNNVFDNLRDAWDRLENEISREGKELAQETRQKMAQYILGKKANYSVQDQEGHLLIGQGEEITEEILQVAEAKNKVSALFLAVVSHELRESIDTLGEQIRTIFR